MYMFNTFCYSYSIYLGYSDGRVEWGTTLQVGRSRVQFSMVSLEFFIDMILPAALWPRGWLSLQHGWVKVNFARYRPGVAQRMGRGIALLFLDRGTRRGRVVGSTLRPHFTPGKDPVPILQEAGWAPGSVWTRRKYRPHRDSILDHPAHSQ